MNGQRFKSNLWLVDLAGSEGIGRTEVEGERHKESQFILGNTFMILCFLFRLLYVQVIPCLVT